MAVTAFVFIGGLFLSRRYVYWLLLEPLLWITGAVAVITFLLTFTDLFDRWFDGA
jgi:hypothetical protein